LYDANNLLYYLYRNGPKNYIPDSARKLRTVSPESARTPVYLAFDWKKIAPCLTENTGDIDLCGFYSHICESRVKIL